MTPQAMVAYYSKVSWNSSRKQVLPQDPAKSSRSWSSLQLCLAEWPPEACALVGRYDVAAMLAARRAAPPKAVESLSSAPVGAGTPMRSFSMATPAAKFGSISPLASRLTSRLTPPGPAHPPPAAGELCCHQATAAASNSGFGCG